MRLAGSGLSLKSSEFQSTHPLRGATFHLHQNRTRSYPFQSTHPLRGATVRVRGGVRGVDISIHAPLAGCDSRRVISFSARWVTFQSTHPLRGATQMIVDAVEAELQFQSTHPLRGATIILCPHSFCNSQFQSTHPLRGATTKIINKLKTNVEFQSTHPLRGATLPGAVWASGSGISIHAPLAGCDVLQAEEGFAVLREISIHAPLAGCDKNCGTCRYHHHISIHAPLAGCDNQFSRESARWLRAFQSTHPLRGATLLLFI